MGKIHLEVEQGRSLVRNMGRAADEIYDSAAMLNSQVGRLSKAWTGGAAEGFVRDARRCTNCLQEYADQFEQLGIRLGNEIDQWVAADADSNFKKPVVRTLPAADPWAPGAGFGSGGGGGGGGGGGWGDSSELPGIEGFKTAIDAVALGGFVVEHVGKVLETAAPWMQNIETLGKWAGQLNVVAEFFGDSWKDWNNPLYDTDSEKLALLIVNMAFAMIKYMISLKIEAAAAALFLGGLAAGIGQALTAIGIPTGVATVVATGSAATAIWIASDAVTDMICDSFKESSLKSELIQKLGSKIDSLYDSVTQSLNPGEQVSSGGGGW